MQPSADGRTRTPRQAGMASKCFLRKPSTATGCGRPRIRTAAQGAAGSQREHGTELRARAGPRRDLASCRLANEVESLLATNQQGCGTCLWILHQCRCPTTTRGQVLWSDRDDCTLGAPSTHSWRAFAGIVAIRIAPYTRMRRLAIRFQPNRMSTTIGDPRCWSDCACRWACTGLVPSICRSPDASTLPQGRLYGPHAGLCPGALRTRPPLPAGPCPGLPRAGPPWATAGWPHAPAASAQLELQTLDVAQDAFLEHLRCLLDVLRTGKPTKCTFRKPCGRPPRARPRSRASARRVCLSAPRPHALRDACSPGWHAWSMDWSHAARPAQLPPAADTTRANTGPSGPPRGPSPARRRGPPRPTTKSPCSWPPAAPRGRALPLERPTERQIALSCFRAKSFATR